MKEVGERPFESCRPDVLPDLYRTTVRNKPCIVKDLGLENMTTRPDNYKDYAQASLASFAQRDAAARNVLVDAVGDRPVRRVLDVGCGAGQDLLPFLDETMALCVGIDVASGLGQIEGGEPLSQRRARFVRATGERMPFANDSFDVVICRVALPYMDNKKTIAEVGTILKPGGVFLLKTHRFRFYLEMIWSRSKTLNPKLIAYPLICLAADCGMN
ncbi:MAG: class I SAM-dependent methyltransferase [Chloracidobacterium sp.]|nr:class I SAM-dependent methyltransferase [Chloracidobacterium sp.]